MYAVIYGNDDPDLDGDFGFFGVFSTLENVLAAVNNVSKDHDTWDGSPNTVMTEQDLMQDGDCYQLGGHQCIIGRHQGQKFNHNEGLYYLIEPCDVDNMSRYGL